MHDPGFLSKKQLCSEQSGLNEARASLLLHVTNSVL